MAVLGYLTSAASGNTLRAERQAAQIERVCARRGWTLLELIREVDAGRGRRPALEYALQRLERGDASSLVVARLESLCYSIADLEVVLTKLNEAGARLVCVDPAIDTESEAGWTVIRALTAVSRRERERLGERTSKGLLTARGKRARSRPAVEDRPELKQRILTMRESGMTLQAIADALNEEGVPTLRGGTRWRPSSVHAATGYKRRENGSSEPPRGPNR